MLLMEDHTSFWLNISGISIFAQTVVLDEMRDVDVEKGGTRIFLAVIPPAREVCCPPRFVCFLFVWISNLNPDIYHPRH